MVEENPSLLRLTLRVVVAAVFYLAVLHYLGALVPLWNFIREIMTNESSFLGLFIFVGLALPVLVLLTPLFCVLAFLAMLPLLVLRILEEVVVGFWSGMKGDK